MKILHVSSLFTTTPPKGYGGIERFVDSLAKAQKTVGNDVHIIAMHGSRSKWYKTHYASDANIIQTLQKVVGKYNPDIIHIHTKANDIIKYLDQNFHYPLVVTIHSNVRKESSWATIIESSSNKVVFTTVSENLRERVIQALEYQVCNYQSRSIIHAPFCFDCSFLDHTNISVKPKYSLYLGVIARYKGVLDIVKAFAALPNEKLKVVGPLNNENERGYFEEVLAVISNAKNIEYYPETKSEKEKCILLQKSKALIMATGYDPQEKDCFEAFGLVMLEANSFGKPIIAYNKGNIVDYVRNGVNGYKYENIDEIERYLKQIDANSISPFKAMQCVIPYCSNKVVHSYLNIYEQLTRVES